METLLVRNLPGRTGARGGEWINAFWMIANLEHVALPVLQFCYCDEPIFDESPGGYIW